jgi:hypothetical protein
MRIDSIGVGILTLDHITLRLRGEAFQAGSRRVLRPAT